MVLKVEVIKKIHKNRKLVGYRVRDEKGNEMNIDKDAVKDAIKSGKVEVTNMTVTSDGRILGAAKTSAKKDIKKEIEYKLIEVYTHGEKMIGALVDESEAVDAGIIDNHDINGLGHGFTFETADVAIDRISNNIYSNISVHGTEVMSDIRRVDFGEVAPTMLNMLKANEVTINESNINPCFNEESSEYTINNPAEMNTNDTIRRAIMLLITHSLYINGFIVNAVNDEMVSIHCDSDSTADDRADTLTKLLDVILETFK